MDFESKLKGLSLVSYRPQVGFFTTPGLKVNYQVFELERVTDKWVPVIG